MLSARNALYCHRVAVRISSSPKISYCFQLSDMCIRRERGRLYVLGHTGIGGTLALTEAAVAADTAGEVQLPRARARVHGDGLLDDEAIGDELADRLARVGVGDLADLVGVEPDLALTAAQDGRRQALLGPQINPISRKKSALCDEISAVEGMFCVCVEVYREGIRCGGREVRSGNRLHRWFFGAQGVGHRERESPNENKSSLKIFLVRVKS